MEPRQKKTPLEVLELRSQVWVRSISIHRAWSATVLTDRMGNSWAQWRGDVSEAKCF